MTRPGSFFSRPRTTLARAPQPLQRLLRPVCVATVLLALVTAALPPSASADAAPETSVRWDPRDARVSDPTTLFDGEQKALYEPTIAVDPTDPGTMIAFAIDLSVQNADPDIYSITRAFRSTDGGRTWSDRGPMRYTAGGTDVTQSGDPVALFDSDGKAYYASLASPEGREGGIWLHRSSNGGASWDEPVLAVAARKDPDTDVCTGTDKEWLGIDPKSGRLYLTYTLFTFRCSRSGVPTDSFTRLSDLGVYLTSSDDGGTTWSTSREIWEGYALGAIPKVGPDGTLYVSFWATVESPPTACPTALGVLAANGGGRPFVSIVAGSSDDGGDTWRFHQQPICDFLAGEVIKPGRFVGGSFLPTLSVDQATGSAHVAYPSFVASQGRFTIEMITSDDRGASWSSPTVVTPGPDDARMPALFADRGITRLVYVQTSGMKDQDAGSTDGTARTMYLESSDGGATWTAPVPLSTEIGKPREFTELGDYIGVDVAAGRIAAIWTDAREGSEYGQIRARTGAVTSSKDPGAGRAMSTPRATLDAPAPFTLTAGAVPRFAPTHRSLGKSPTSSGGGSCPDRQAGPRLVRFLERPRATSLHLDCSVSTTLVDVGKTAEALGYVPVFSDDEGFEAELLLARGDDLLLVKIVRSTAPEGGAEIFVQRF